MSDLVKRLREYADPRPGGVMLHTDFAEAADEIERLRGERDAYKNALGEVREIYAGMEGFEPKTAPEAYCLRVIREMARAAMKENSDE